MHRADENKIQTNPGAASTNEDDSHASAATTDDSVNDNSAVHFPSDLDHGAHTMSGHSAGMVKPNYTLAFGSNRRRSGRRLALGGAENEEYTQSEDHDMFNSYLIQTTSISEFNELFTPSVYSALRAVLPENNGIFDQCLRTISYVSL